MIPSELRRDNSWVVCKADNKIPLQITDNPASTSNEMTWNSYTNCKVTVADGTFDYLGYVFHDTGIIGIDFDYGVNDGVLCPEVQSIVDMCNSYTEYSKSGRGVHIYLKGKIPFEGRNNRNGCEIYKSGRFFIVTEKPVLNTQVIENQAAIDYILQNYFSVTKSQDYTISENYYEPTWHIEYGKIPYPIYPEIEQGGRNLSLLSYGGQLLCIGYNDTDIYRELLKVNTMACRPPLTVYEIQQIVTSLGRYRK